MDLKNLIYFHCAGRPWNPWIEPNWLADLSPHNAAAFIGKSLPTLYPHSEPTSSNLDHSMSSSGNSDRWPTSLYWNLKQAHGDVQAKVRGFPDATEFPQVTLFLQQSMVLWQHILPQQSSTLKGPVIELKARQQTSQQWFSAVFAHHKSHASFFDVHGMILSPSFAMNDCLILLVSTP